MKQRVSVNKMNISFPMVYLINVKENYKERTIKNGQWLQETERKQTKQKTQKTKKINNTDLTKNPEVIRGACEGSHPPC